MFITKKHYATLNGLIKGLEKKVYSKQLDIEDIIQEDKLIAKQIRNKLMYKQADSADCIYYLLSVLESRGK